MVSRVELMKIKDRIAKLIDVKSIITITLVSILCVTTLNGQPTPELFNSAVMLVLGFFFGKKINQESDDENQPT